MTLEAKKHPCLFLFDSGADQVNAPALRSFIAALLGALSTADPNGTLVAELRGGVSTLSDSSSYISEVSAGPKRSGHTMSHDMPLFRLMLWDAAHSLSEGSGSPDTINILNVLRLGREECLALSDVPDTIRISCDNALKPCAGYVGSCRLDAGNPIQRRAFYDGLMHLALISNGSVIQQRSVEGDEDWELGGASSYKPNGIKWIDHYYGAIPIAFQLPAAPHSARGLISLDRLRRRTSTKVEGRVFRALIDASWTDKKGAVYSFSTAEAGHDILQAILPEGKFTDYLFNRDHSLGGAKAKFIIDELGFDPSDWRYLAAQFYDGFLLSEPRDLVVERWKEGYGARFNNYVEVTSRVGKRGIMRTGWIIETQKLPRLVTAFPDRPDHGVVRPSPPPVLPPCVEDDTWWENLFAVAHEHGQAAHAATLPTPMLLADWGIIEEGECGMASVLVPNTRIGFGRWILKTDRGARDPRGRVAISCKLHSQSVERATAYARAFARVLALNGVPSNVESRYT